MFTPTFYLFLPLFISLKFEIIRNNLIALNLKKYYSTSIQVVI